MDPNTISIGKTMVSCVLNTDIYVSIYRNSPTCIYLYLLIFNWNNHEESITNSHVIITKINIHVFIFYI